MLVLLLAVVARKAVKLYFDWYAVKLATASVELVRVKPFPPV